MINIYVIASLKVIGSFASHCYSLIACIPADFHRIVSRWLKLFPGEAGVVYLVRTRVFHGLTKSRQILLPIVLCRTPHRQTMRCWLFERITDNCIAPFTWKWDKMDRDQTQTADRGTSTPAGLPSVVSADKEGHISVSIKPDQSEENLKPNKPRGSCTNGSVQIEFDSLADKTIIEPEEEDFEYNCCTSAIERVHSCFCNCFARRKTLIKRIVCVIFIIAYFVYFGCAVHYSFTGATVVVVLTCLVGGYLIFKFIWKKAGGKIYQCCCAPVGRFFQSKFWSYFRW